MHWTCCNIADFTPQELEKAYENLSPSRKEHIDRFRRQEDKMRSLAAELLVYQLLCRQLSVTDGRLCRRENGQPYLENCSLYVSIAHSGDKVACAISESPVGIDIERIRPIKSNLWRQVCVEAELRYLLDGKEIADGSLCTDEVILQRFFEIWTGKEAYFKRQGTGITDLKSINILALPRQVHSVDGYMVQII